MELRHIWTQRLTEHIELVQAQTEKGRWAQRSNPKNPTKKLFDIDRYGESENQFSAIECTWYVNHTLRRAQE